MAQVVRIHQTGGPDVLTLDEVELLPPGPGEVRLKQTYAGLNFIDVYFRTGLYPASQLPMVLGQEAAARVVALGPGVTGLKVGQRVAYAGLQGAYATERNALAERLVPLPDGIDDVTAASVMLKGMTAEYLLRRCYPVKKGETVLFHAAAGGVGLLACQWAKALGARVIGTVSTPEKAALARQAGCDEVIVSTKRNFVTDVRAFTGGKGVDVAYDSVGVATFESSLACLKPRGMLVLFGQSSGKVPPYDLGRLGGERSLYVTRPALGAYTATRAELVACATALFEVLAKGAVRVKPPNQFPLQDVANAHRQLEARKTVGSTVLVIDAAAGAVTAPAQKRAAKAAKAKPAKAAKKKR
jgi:NADPH:quinone reductase